MHPPSALAASPAPLPPGQWYDRLGLLLESTGEGIFGIDLDGHCVFINRAGAALLGHPEPQALLGLNMHDLTHHSEANGTPYPVERCPIFNAFRQGLPCRIDSEVFWRPDGSSFPVEYTSYPIQDGAHILGAVITFVDITERKAAEQALQEAKQALEERVAQRTQALGTALQQLRELAAHSDTVREEERTRIAREIHDELGSLLVALKMDVGWMDKRLSEQAARSPEAQAHVRQTLRGKCQHMGRLIEQAVDNVGRIITDLRPSILDHQGLWAALEWQAQEFVQSAELSLGWHLPGQGLPELPAADAMAVFRIFQEMLSNVGRHAQATTLDVRVQTTPRSLVLTVCDNGRGASMQAFEASDAYGIMGMRERARHLGGELRIWSQPGLGSCFQLVLPNPASPQVRCPP
jgi:PAS domain S-box-containing protein